MNFIYVSVFPESLSNASSSSFNQCHIIRGSYSFRKVSPTTCPRSTDAYSEASHGVIVSVQGVRSEGHSCRGFDCQQLLWPPKIQQDWKGLCRDPGASGVERKIAQGDYRWMKNETWKWRMIALSLSLPSGNLLVLCHVIKLLKGQTFHTLHHTNLFTWPFITVSRSYAWTHTW